MKAGRYNTSASAIEVFINFAKLERRWGGMKISERKISKVSSEQ